MLNIVKKQEGETLTVKLDGRLDTLTFQQELEEKDKSMMLCHVNDIIRDVFDVTGFLDILTIE